MAATFKDLIEGIRNRRIDDPAQALATLLGSATWTFTDPVTLELGATFKNQSTPATPAAGYTTVYAQTNQGHTQLNLIDEDGTILRMNRDNVLIVRNTSGSDMVKGAVVHFTGSTGTVPTVGLADADDITLHAEGILAEAIANNGFGLLMIAGQVSGLDTHLLSEGATIYLSSSAGLYATTAPSAPAFRQALGIVLRSHATQGSLEVGLTQSAVFVQGANPSASVGLTAVNGTSQAFLRADGAPALDVNIAPTWTNTHIWTDNDKVILGTGSDLELYHDGTDSFIKSNTGILKMPLTGSQYLNITGATPYVQIDGSSGSVSLELGVGSQAFIGTISANSLDIYTNNTLRARFPSNSGEAFAISSLDASGECYIGFYESHAFSTRKAYFGFGDTSDDIFFLHVEEASDLRLMVNGGLGFYMDGTYSDMRGGGNVRFAADATGLGFFATTPIAKPTVSGSRGANAALASLCTALANLGLITNSTS